MKIKRCLLVLILFVSQMCFSQTTQADAILGKYFTANNEGIVEVTKRNAKYYGKLIWIRPNANLDLNNPDELERKKSLRGKEILKDFMFENNTWHSGTIYDPNNGKTYSCKATMDEKGNLNVRGYIGFSLLGRTTYWLKVK